MSDLIRNEQFITLVTSHQRQLMRYLQVLVQNRSDAEDLLQETNLHICRHADEFQIGTDFAAWALRIAYFRVLKWRTQQSRNRLVLDDAMLEQLAVAAQSSDVLADQRRDKLENCVRQLSPEEQLLTSAFYGDQDSTRRAMAERLGRSLDSVYVSIHRIRAKLLECIRRKMAAEERLA